MLEQALWLVLMVTSITAAHLLYVPVSRMSHKAFNKLFGLRRTYLAAFCARLFGYIVILTFSLSAIWLMENVIHVPSEHPTYFIPVFFGSYGVVQFVTLVCVEIDQAIRLRRQRKSKEVPI